MENDLNLDAMIGTLFDDETCRDVTGSGLDRSPLAGDQRLLPPAERRCTSSAAKHRYMQYNLSARAQFRVVIGCTRLE